jgi:UDP-N-acetylmuramate dehydrogenase
MTATRCVAAPRRSISTSRSTPRRRARGLEFLSGIPGTIGGAVRMNAGAYGREMSDVLDSGRGDRSAGRACAWLTIGELGFAYRHCDVPEDWIFTARACARRRATNLQSIAARMAEIREAREASQPIRARTGGSTFKNPPEGRKAWEADRRRPAAAGCARRRAGQREALQLPDQHRRATADDIETLGEECARASLRASASLCEWEIKRIGLVSKIESDSGS